jgi:FKBP-type peptidyl-prolyl cis-trans isomerase SlyD
MSVTRGDFIRLSYTGRLDNGDVFDTTNGDVAKENDLFAEGVSYAPIVVIAGENMVVTGLDEDLMGKASGYEGQVKIQPKDAFGERKPELVEVVPTRRFEKRPTPGMRVSLDNRTGTVESVIGGRVRVDFNSPYAGKTIVYDYTIEKIVDKAVDKVKGLLKYYLNKDFNVSIAKKRVKVDMPYELGFNPQVQYYKKLLAEKIMQFTDMEEVDYIEAHKRPKPVSEEAVEGASEETSEEKADQQSEVQEKKEIQSSDG